MTGKKSGRGAHLKPRDAAGMAELRKLANTPEAKAKAAATRRRNAEIRRAAKAAGTAMVITPEARTAIAAGRAKQKKLAAALGIPVAFAQGPAEMAAAVKKAKPKKKRKTSKRAKRAGHKAKGHKVSGILAKKVHAKRAKKASKPKHKKASKPKHKKASKPKHKKAAKHPKHKKASKPKHKRTGHLVKGHASAKGHCPHCGGPHTKRQHWSHAVKPGKYSYRRATKSGRPHKGRSTTGLLGYIFG